MRFLHTGDLHIGKTVNEFSMIEDQRHMLLQIQDIACKKQVDAIVIAGDVYDRPIPSTEAVGLLDDFLTFFMEKNIPVILISGNHDSGERVAFADRILEKQGVYISGGYEGQLKRVHLLDEWGTVEFVCMPFVKPAVASVEEMLAGEAQERTAAAGETQGAQGNLKAERRVLITHYFVTGENGQQPELSDSESQISVGGLDNVSAGIFAEYDYVALGHIHKRQRIGAGQVWYAGAPLKYSFSEVRQTKSVNIVDLGKKGEVTVECEPIEPIRQMRVIKGELDKLLAAGELETDREDYIKAILTDKEELIDPIGSLRSIYPNVMQIELAKNSAMQAEGYVPVADQKRKSIEELFSDFYEMLRGEPMDEKRREIVREQSRPEVEL